jgi:hypothetical protein
MGKGRRGDPCCSHDVESWVQIRFDLALHVARRYVSGVPQAKRHAGWRSRGRASVLDAFADLDRVGEHAFDAIKPRDEVVRSGWVGFCRQLCSDLLVGGDCVSLDDEASGWSGGFRRCRTEAATGLARMSAMLCGEMTPLVEAIELHKEPWIPPLPGMPTIRCLDLDSPQGGQPQWFSCSARGNLEGCARPHGTQRTRRVYTGSGLCRVKPYVQSLV